MQELIRYATVSSSQRNWPISNVQSKDLIAVPLIHVIPFMSNGFLMLLGCTSLSVQFSPSVQVPFYHPQQTTCRKSSKTLNVRSKSFEIFVFPFRRKTIYMALRVFNLTFHVKREMMFRATAIRICSRKQFHMFALQSWYPLGAWNINFALQNNIHHVEKGQVTFWLLACKTSAGTTVSAKWANKLNNPIVWAASPR